MIEPQTDTSIETLPGDADQPQWLHPISLVFEFAAGIRSQLVPALLALFSATTGSWIGGSIALVFFVGSMALVVLRYLRLRYRLVGSDLIVDEGFVFRVHRTVPVERIQNIDLVQNPFHRLFGVAEVRIETASGTEPEAVLRVLSLADVESLRTRIFARKQSFELSRAAVPPTAGEADVVAAEPPVVGAVHPAPSRAAFSLGRDDRMAQRHTTEHRETLVALSLRQLALAGIASNRGTVLLLVGLGVIWQQSASVIRRWHIETEDVTRYLSERTGAIVWLWLAIGGVVAVLALVKALSIVWYVLKFYDYRLDRAGDDLRVSCGLLTRVSATVRRDRIQLISIHRTVVGRWLRIASIRIESAGGGGESDDPATSIARRWFMPVISETQIPSIMQQLSPGLTWDEPTFKWQLLSSRAARRMRRATVLLPAGLAIIAGAIGFYPVAIPLVLLAGLGWWWSKRWASAIRYARVAGHIVFRSGVFTRKCSLAFIDKIQAVSVDRSPFDRRWGMATLSIDTIAAGPAEHLIAIPMLDVSVARQERDLICQAASGSM